MGVPDKRDALLRISEALGSLASSVEDALAGRIRIPDLVKRYAATRQLLNRQFAEIVQQAMPRSSQVIEQTRTKVSDRMSQLFGGRSVDQYLRVAAYAGVQPKLLEHLLANVGTDVAVSELRLLTGDQVHTERRLRELRDLGFEVTWTRVGDEESYRLHRLEPDLDAAARFQLEHRIKEDSSLNATEKMLSLLKAELGRPVNTRRLQQLSGGQSQYDRRVRELRERYHISTGLNKPALASDEYQLESLVEKDPHDQFRAATIRQIFERDGYRCIDCGWSKSDRSSFTQRYLEAHHIRARAAGGESSAGNGVTLCNSCHRGRHAVT